jgi:DNA (cytosine-5)-methyltransferase 1
MKAIELFAGAGGAALGLEAAGVHHLALCEWDADACATLRAAGLGPVVEGDVRDLDAIASTATQSPDLLWASFPCQCFSTAGSRAGAKDARNGWPWTVDAIDRFRPRWFLAENVRGLLCHRGDCDRSGPPEDCPGCYFERVILVELRERFPVVGWFLLDAADHGVPQHRRRVFIHAGPAPVTPPRATHGPGMFTRPWKSMGEALGLDGFVVAAGVTGEGRPRCTSKSAPTIGAIENAYSIGDNGLRVIGGGRNASDGTRTFRDLTTEPSTTVAAVQIGNAGPWIVGDGPSLTISTADGHGIGSKDSRDRLEKMIGRRRLTVEECAILQDFPVDHPFQGTTKSSRYRQVGNAVPPKLAQVVVETVLEADRRHKNADG